MNLKHYADNGMTYTQYRALVDDLLAQDKTTGPNQSDDLVKYARLNQKRMQRLEKTFAPSEGFTTVVSAVTKPVTILVITEGWCGDAAQIVPVIAALDKMNPNILTRYVLRDEHTELIDEYLTNGGRAIPIIVFFETETGNEIAHWGPRPKACQQVMDDLKTQNAPLEVKIEAVHTWYAKDKTLTTQAEIGEILGRI